jgi:hypothetical protein
MSGATAGAANDTIRGPHYARAVTVAMTAAAEDNHPDETDEGDSGEADGEGDCGTGQGEHQTVAEAGPG